MILPKRYPHYTFYTPSSDGAHPHTTCSASVQKSWGGGEGPGFNYLNLPHRRLHSTNTSNFAADLNNI
jgi:hypothetical protein